MNKFWENLFCNYFFQATNSDSFPIFQIYQLGNVLLHYFESLTGNSSVCTQLFFIITNFQYKIPHYLLLRYLLPKEWLSLNRDRYYQIKNLDIQLKLAFKAGVLALFFEIWINKIRVRFTSSYNKKTIFPVVREQGYFLSLSFVI